METMEGEALGAPPAVDLAETKKTADFVRSLIERGLVNAVHDVSDGGIACAAAEMAMASGVGVAFCGPEPGEGSELEQLFGERTNAFLIAVNDEQSAEWDSRGFLPFVLGEFEGDAITMDLGVSPNIVSHSVKLAELRAANEGWMPGFMAGA